MCETNNYQCYDNYWFHTFIIKNEIRDSTYKFVFQGSWEKKMIERVQNVNSRKRNASGPAEGSLTPKRGRPKSSNVRLYPDIPVINNDDESLESDNIALKKELELAKPRKEVVLSLMRKTYTYRREYILATKDRMSMNDLISMYQGYTYCYCVS